MVRHAWHAHVPDASRASALSHPDVSHAAWRRTLACTAATSGAITDGGNGDTLLTLIFAQHVTLGFTGSLHAEHKVAVPQQRKLVRRHADTFAQPLYPTGLEPSLQILESFVGGIVVQAGARWRRWFSGAAWVERIDRLMAEAGDAVPDQIGPHHAFGEARLPRLVDQMFPLSGLEVWCQSRQQRRCRSHSKNS